MNISDFVETVAGVKLYTWQKVLLEGMSLPDGTKLVINMKDRWNAASRQKLIRDQQETIAALCSEHGRPMP